MRHLSFSPVLALLLAGCRAVTTPVESPRGQEAPLLPEHLTGLASLLLELHNRERSEVSAPPLVWDDRLAAAAAAYGPLLAREAALVHAPAALRPGQGENLWMGTRNRYSLPSMFDGWAREKRLFRAGVFPGVSRTGRWTDVAHYTQIVWRGTARVGCAIHRAAEWDYLICRYTPPGNVRGQKIP
ncbi:MAG: CAP domain-containing protein [Pseudomonadota bacterium]|nr:CAP domain-containing protein [Pseudomonadota bacterium]